ncbi:TPA: response regulator [Candidatus Woesearchaeota archaeon]|nr:response regulator [Candidatus Woesearchaeota archaeon]
MSLADKVRILYVENDISQSETVKGILERKLGADYSIELAISYPKAVEAIKKNGAKHYALYILDVKLKDGNGIDIVRMLRKSKQDQGMGYNGYIVILTDGPFTQVKAELEGVGIRKIEYVMKPLAPEEKLNEFVAMLRKIAGKKDSLGNYIAASDDYLDGT